MIYFRVIYKDNKNKTFNVSKIITDDSSITKRTSELIKKGRDVNISTTDIFKDKTKVPSIEEVKADVKFDYDFDSNLKW